MNNWKHYAGSVLLAGLLLQGCSSTPEDDKLVVEQTDNSAAKTAKANANTLVAVALADTPDEAKLAISADNFETSDKAEAFIKDALAKLVTAKTITQEEADAFAANTDLNQFFLDNLEKTEIFGVLPVMEETAQKSVSRNALFDKIKNGLVDIMDSSLGGKVTGAAFELVLNSEGVTVFMLDLAYKSRTISEIMIDAIGANPSLMVKMCPMLQTNKEFGEKFTALAYDMSPVTKEGAPDMGEFFFAVVDAPMYGCLTDAMLLSSHDADHGEYGDENYVQHSTTAYMGMLMARHAATFFITPGTESKDVKWGRTDAFSSLMFDTGVNVDYNASTNTFANHGDANELSNEQLFYALFKTPDATGSFIGAMNELNVTTQTMFMDKIFLGAEEGKDTDTVQGYLNIISIGSAMYDGIFGEKNAEGVRVNEYGFGAYTGAFIDFAKLIPSDRYLAYGKGFMDAGFAYAEYNGISVWDEAVAAGTAAGQDLWDSYTTDSNATVTASTNAPARSAGSGTLKSEWFADSMMVFASAWDNISFTNIYDAVMSDDNTLLGGLFKGLNDEANVAYNTVLDGRDANKVAMYPTTIINTIATNDTVYGFHGLIQLAMREDIVNTQHAENNASYTMADAEAAFTLPLFADLTWSFAYTTATDGAIAYYNSFVNAGWLADLSTNELVREYFYPDADNVYIPSWLLAVDWLTLPDNFSNANIADTDFNFDAGFMDIYVASTNPNLIATLDLPQVSAPVKPITMEKIEMGSDSIIAVDENGQTLAGLYIYKVRVVSPQDTAAVLAYLSALGDDALAAIGIDSDNAAVTVAPAEEA